MSLLPFVPGGRHRPRDSFKIVSGVTDKDQKKACGNAEDEEEGRTTCVQLRIAEVMLPSHAQFEHEESQKNFPEMGK